MQQTRTNEATRFRPGEGKTEELRCAFHLQHKSHDEVRKVEILLCLLYASGETRGLPCEMFDISAVREPHD